MKKSTKIIGAVLGVLLVAALFSGAAAAAGPATFDIVDWPSGAEVSSEPFTYYMDGSDFIGCGSMQNNNQACCNGGRWIDFKFRA